MFHKVQYWDHHCLIYIDTCTSEISLLLKFADDTKGFQVIQGPGDRDKLQNALDNLVQWANTYGNEVQHTKMQNNARRKK